MDGGEQGQTRQQTGVLDGIPGPKATPPQLGVGPSGPEGQRRDAHSERDVRPPTVRSDGGRDHEGLGGVEQRRVDGHRRMPQDGKQPAAIDGRGGQTAKR